MLISGSQFGEEFFSPALHDGAPLPVSRSWRNSSLPSWWEFVQFVRHTPPHLYDEHWRPASLYCSVCSIHFTHILHFENIQQEEAMFARLLNATEMIRPRWENRDDGGLAKQEILAKYFSLLDDEDIQDLYRIYQDDFKMFDYTFEYKNFKLNT